MSRLLLASSLMLLAACSLTTDFGAFSGPGNADDEGGANGEPTGGDPGGGSDNTGSGPKAGELSVLVTVEGPGMVTSEGFECSAETCDTKREANTMLVLTAVPNAEAAFDGWRGPCLEDELDGAVDQISASFVCTLKVDDALEVTAIFAGDHWFDLTVTRSGSGAGKVASVDGRLLCEGSELKPCSARYVKGASVSLTAEPEPGRGVFSGWGGACTGQAECVVSMFDTRTVDAVFNLDGYGALIVTKPGRGRGFVSSTPAGVVCGDQCSASYPLSGAAPPMVMLKAQPEDSSTFSGFSGDCAVQTDVTQCLATVDDIERVNAEFAFKSYALTVTWSGNGGGSVTGATDGMTNALACSKPGPCAAQFEYGTAVSLTAQPTEGSMFVGWSGGGCGLEATCKVDLTKDTMVVANFAVAEYAVTVGVTGEGAVLCNGAACEPRYVHGTSVTFSAPPAVGWQLMAWEGACAGTAVTDACTKVITQNTTVRAVFAKKRYKLTVSIAGTGTGSVSGTLACDAAKQPCTSEVSKGDPIKLSAMAGANSMFAGWGGACGGTGECVIDNVGAETMVIANFAIKEVTKTTLVVAKSGKGTIASAPAGITCADGCSGANASFNDGTSVELSATPATGYGAPSFAGCDTTNAGKCQIAMNDADDTEEVRVSFAPSSVPVTVTVAGNGSGNVAAMGITCATGNSGDCTENRPFDSTYVLTATPSNGSTFSGWSGACAGVRTPQCEITIDQANAVTATFTLRNFRVQSRTTGGFDGTSKVTRDPVGAACASASPDCGVYGFGSDVTVTATPGVGSSFVRWMDDAMACGSNPSCPLNDIDADKRVGAEFAANVYQVDVTVTGSGVVRSREMPTPRINCWAGGDACSSMYTHSSSLTLEAVPPVVMPPGISNVRFTGWGGACSGSSQCSLNNLTANASVTAAFIDQYPVTINLGGFVNSKMARYVRDQGSFACQANAAPCRYVADADSTVTLTATPPPGADFAGWDEVKCAQGTQTELDCTFTVTPGLSVTANFSMPAPPAMRTLTVMLDGDGAGGAAALVTATADGSRTPFLSCFRGGKGCTGTVAEGTLIHVAASAPAWADATGLSGACTSGTPTCDLTIRGDATITASFASRGNLMFVTEKVYEPTFGQAGGASELCAAAAAAGGLDTRGTFIAWLSWWGIIQDLALSHYTPATQNTAVIIRPDGETISKQGLAALLVNGPAETSHLPISITESGTQLKDKTPVWTGTLGTGDTGNYCRSWSSPDPTVDLGTVGDPFAMDVEWTARSEKNGTNISCAERAHLYCVQDF